LAVVHSLEGFLQMTTKRTLSLDDQIELLRDILSDTWDQSERADLARRLLALHYAADGEANQ
jgi:hypothetical protein